MRNPCSQAVQKKKCEGNMSPCKLSQHKTLTEGGLVIQVRTHICVHGEHLARLASLGSLGTRLHCEDPVRVHVRNHVYVQVGHLARLAPLGSLGARTIKSIFEKRPEGRLARLASLGSLGAFYYLPR